MESTTKAVGRLLVVVFSHCSAWETLDRELAQDGITDEILQNKITPLSQSTDRHIRQFTTKQGNLQHVVNGEGEIHGVIYQEKRDSYFVLCMKNSLGLLGRTVELSCQQNSVKICK